MSTSSPSIPHFAYPFTFSASNGAGVVEQDSFEDVLSCVSAIVACDVGACPELPTFGIPDMTFQQGAPDPSDVMAAVQNWEPRADEAAVVQAIDQAAGSWSVSLSTRIVGTGQ